MSFKQKSGPLISIAKIPSAELANIDSRSASAHSSVHQQEEVSIDELMEQAKLDTDKRPVPQESRTSRQSKTSYGVREQTNSKMTTIQEVPKKSHLSVK